MLGCAEAAAAACGWRPGCLSGDGAAAAARLHQREHHLRQRAPALRRHAILQWVLQTDSQQGACPPRLLPPSLGAWTPMELGSAGHNLFLVSDLPAIITWLLFGT